MKKKKPRKIFLFLSRKRNDLDGVCIYIKISTHKANNGCLGDSGLRRTQTAAIFVGEVLTTFDPAVSEWSNPSDLPRRTLCKIRLARVYIALELGTA